MVNKKMKLALITALLFLSTAIFASDGLKYGIKPSFSQTKLDADLMAVYNQWKGDDVIEDPKDIKTGRDGYLAQYKDTGEAYPIYIIKGDATGDNPDDWSSYPDTDLKPASTSEATGYGMIIFALMGDKDPKAQEYFDGLMNLYLRNLSTTEVTENGTTRTLNTMSWIVPSKYTLNDGTQPARSGSACDGDLDIAYALLLADKQWGTPSSYANTDKSYKELAIALIKDIRDYIISSESNRILMGDSYFFLTEGTWDGTCIWCDDECNVPCTDKKFNHTSTRPSDWMAGHLRVFNTVVPDDKWSKAVNEIYRILPIVSNDTTSLAPDFVEDKNGSPIPGYKSIDGEVYVEDDAGNWVGHPIKKYMEGYQDDMYANNACRVPWRIATDYIHNGTEEAKAYLDKINNWSKDIPTRLIRGGYKKADFDGDGVEEEHYGWEEMHDNDWWLIDEFHSTPAFPRNISSGYTLEGDPIVSKYNEFGQPEDVANWQRISPSVENQFVSPLAFANVAGGTGAQERLDASWTFMTDEWTFGGANEDKGYTCYFGDSINLLNLFMVSGNWFNPATENNVAKNYQILRSEKWYELLQDAIDESQDGDTIRVYTQELNKIISLGYINNKNNLTIESVPGSEPVVLRGYSRYSSGLQISNSKNITIRNLKIVQYLGESIYISETCENIVLDNVIAGMGKGFEDLSARGKNITIKNCHFYRMVYFEDIENLNFHHNVVGGSPLIDAPSLGIRGSVTGDINIYNNVFQVPYYGIHLKAGNATIKNNIFYKTYHPNNPVQSPENDPYYKYDIFLENGATATADYNLHSLESKITNTATIGPNKIFGDPKFEGTGYEREEFYLKTGSPAIDAGVLISGITDNVVDGFADLGPNEAVNAAARPLAYNSDADYLDGSTVTNMGKTYVANYDTSGEAPGSAPYPYTAWDETSSQQTVSDDPFYWGTGYWWNYYNSSNAYSTMYNENGVLRTDIYDGGENLWDVIVAKNVSIEQGKYYTVVFEAKTEKEVEIQVVVSQGDAPYKAYSKYHKIQLSSEMQQYSFRFRMDHMTDNNAKIEFDLGGEETPQDIWIDNVKLIKQ